MKIGGHFNGTSADCYVCLGFVPDFVTLWNIEGTQILRLDWNNMMSKDVHTLEGIQSRAATSEAVGLAVGTGIAPFVGGYMLDATMAGTTTYGEGVYLKRDDYDYRRVHNTPPGVTGDSLINDVDTWTLDSGYTGHFNATVTGTYVGIGSRILIDGRWYTIQACTSPQLTATNVGLNITGVPSGKVTCITGKYGYKPMVAGEMVKSGFCFYDATNVINVNDQTIVFEAGMYDRSI